MEPLTTAKVAATFIIFAITFAFGIIPFLASHLLKKRFEPQKYSKVISFLNCFAGGVFLGTAMLHLLAESEEQLKDALTVSNETEITYPVTEVVISGGFLFILVTEVIFLRIMQGVEKEPAEKYAYQNKTMDSENNVSNGRYTITTPGDVTITEGNSTASGIHHDIRKIIESKPSSLRLIILIIALSLHMIFEALAVGLQETEAELWTLLLALSFHKSIVAFSVGLEMQQVLSNVKLILFLFLFASIAASGVPIGIAVTDSDDDRSLVSGILQSMATGTFFYITFFEILQREFSHCRSVLKLIPCLVGFGGVACLKILDKD